MTVGLVAGIYLGGLAACWANLWVRDDDLSVELVIGALAWPISLMALLVAGKYAVRRHFHILTNQEIDDLCEEAALLRERVSALERAREARETRGLP